MKSPIKKKRSKSILEIIQIYLKELKKYYHSGKTPPFIDEILEKKNIFYDSQLLEKILSKLEQRDFIRRIDGVTYLKDDSKNYFSEPFDIQHLISFSNTIFLYEITGQGIIFSDRKIKIQKRNTLKIIRYLIKYLMLLNDVFYLLGGYLFYQFQESKKLAFRFTYYCCDDWLEPHFYGGASLKKRSFLTSFFVFILQMVIHSPKLTFLTSKSYSLWFLIIEVDNHHS